MSKPLRFIQTTFVKNVDGYMDMVSIL